MCENSFHSKLQEEVFVRPMPKESVAGMCYPILLDWSKTKSKCFQCLGNVVSRRAYEYYEYKDSSISLSIGYIKSLLPSSE